MGVVEDASILLFATRGVQQVVADYQKMENAARNFEKLQANAYYTPSVANSQALQDAVRNAGVEAAQRAALASTVAIGLLKTEISLVKAAISEYAQYGRTVQNIQALSGASLGSSEKFVNLARVAGVPDQQATREIMRLSQDMFSGQGRAALSRLGIDSMGKDTLTVFEQATGALSRMQDGAKRTNLEMQLFGGRLSQSLQPFLHISSDVQRRTEELSNTLDGSALQAINGFQQSVNLLGLTVMKDLVFPLADALLPSLTWVIDEVQATVEWIRKLDEMMGGALKWGAIFVGIAGTVGTAAKAIEGLIGMYNLLKDAEIVQIGIKAVMDMLEGPVGWASVAGAVAIGGAAYIGYNQMAGNGDDKNGTGETINNAAQTLQQGAQTFAGAVNGLARSLSNIGGSEISGRMSEADLALILQRSAQGIG